MEIIEDNPAARWLPSRHRFALARLIAFLIHRRASRIMTVDHLLLSVDRDQSAIENYAISIWMLAASSAYVASLLPLRTAAAILLGIPIAAFLLQLPIYFGANSAVLMVLAFCAAAYFATVDGPVHYVALLSLMVFITNSVAWMINRACGI